jgi:hypothetical protein
MVAIQDFSNSALGLYMFVNTMEGPQNTPSSSMTLL